MEDLIDHVWGQHMKDTSRGGRVACAHCERSFRSYGALATHFKNDHVARVYICGRCGYQTSSKIVMIVHCGNHTNN